MLGFVLTAAFAMQSPMVVSNGLPVVGAQPALQLWRPGDVRCGASLERFTVVRRAANGLGWSSAPPAPLTFRFRIDASGRPLSVTRSAADPYMNGYSDDIAPALVASRFAAGAERRDCSVTYTATRVALADAAAEELIAYNLAPISGALPQAGWDRILGSEATCARPPRPEPLLRAYPRFRAIPATPGARDWTMIGYDLDRNGKPIRIRRVAGTGNAALDSASATAVAGSRFAGGSRTGCVYPYWRAAGTLAPPEPPAEAALKPAGATCPEHLPFVRQPTLTFPAAYQRRAIEGWAVVAYDVAPWGAVGNPRVLAVEPSADFGEWALNVIRSATKAASNTGYVGCVDRVFFRMGDEARMKLDGEPIAPDSGVPPPD